MIKILKMCLFLLLINSLLSFNVNINNDKSPNLQIKKQRHIRNVKTDRAVKGIDVSKIDRGREPYRQVNSTPVSLSIAETEAVENAMDRMGLTGLLMIQHVVGKTTMDYATAYFARSIAMGLNLILHAVWSSHLDLSNVVFYARSEDHGVNWSAQIPIHDGYYGYKPAIAVDPNNSNNVFVAYVGYQNEGEIRSVRVIRSTDGGLTWGASVPIYGSAANCNNPDIIVDEQGNPHVVFDSYEDEHILYNYSVDGDSLWFEEPELVTYDLNTVGTFGPTIALDKNGNPHVAFGEGMDGSWNILNCYTNWRDMAAGVWVEAPSVQHPNNGDGTCATSIVFDSDNKGHFFYDGGGGTQSRSVWYRTMTYTEATEDSSHGSWDFSIPEEFVLSVEAGGSTFWPSAAIDQHDNLYLMYIDNLAVGSIGSDGGDWDIFTGTNISGDWNFTNLTANGSTGIERYPGATSTVFDTTFHLLYTRPPDIIHELGYPWPPSCPAAVYQLPDTYNLIGPFKIVTEMGCNEEVIESCSLYVWINEELELTLAMTETEPGHWEIEFTINGHAGDVVTYQTRAVDADGLTGSSFPCQFEILEPANPSADILLIGDQMQILDMFDQVISDLGYVYEYWDVGNHNGIDASITTWGWNNIIVAGWGVTTIPTRAYPADQPYVQFMEGGGNLALIDMDYFFSNGEEGAVDLTFDPGDFAYDYLNIGGGVSDPGEQDDVLMGVDGDEISGNFAEAPFLQFFPDLAGIDNWIDWAYTGSADDIFYALTVGYECGVKNDAGSYKTVFLPFMFEWLVEQVGENVVPNADAYTLMDNILTWFEAVSSPIIGEVNGPRYGVYGTGPYDVYAEVSDTVLVKAAGALVSIEVGYITDEMNNYAWIEMTDNSDGSYSGQIPELAVGDTVLWKVKATDDAGNYRQTEPTEFWITGLEATEGVYVLYCGYDPYDWYYPSSPDSALDVLMREALTGTNFDYDFWDVDVHGTPDYLTVLSNYRAAIWHGFAEWEPVFPVLTKDNPFAEFLANGGRLLCSSDELLGTHSTYVQNDFSGPWFDVNFGPGWAAYDVLGVTRVYNDYNYSDIVISEPDYPIFMNIDTDSIISLAFGFKPGLNWNFSDYIELVANAYYIFLGDDGAGNLYYANSLRTDRLGSETEARVVFLPWVMGAISGLELRTELVSGMLRWLWFRFDQIEKEISSDIPTTHSLYHNFPNPFNPETAIRYDLPEQGRVTLTIYNLLGCKIKTLVDKDEEAGRYLVSWDGKNDLGETVTSGIYFYRMQVGNFVQSRKMILVK